MTGVYCGRSGSRESGVTQLLQRLRRDVEWITARSRAASFDELVVVDLSRDDMPMAVVRVIIPGLETMTEAQDYRPGRGPGRCALPPDWD